MGYTKLQLKQDFIVKKIVTVHYFEYMSNFQFAGESHPFWEFLCVDKGEVIVTADNRLKFLKKDDIIFHKPDEFHSLKANGITAPNLVVIAFECNSAKMRYFENKILHIGEMERNLLGAVIAEARNAFASDLEDPYLTEMVRSPKSKPGSEQLIRLYLEEVLIRLWRTGEKPDTTEEKRPDTETYCRIISYMQENIGKPLRLSQICRDNFVSLSQLQNIFHERHHSGVTEYFIKLKISRAKQLIRENHFNYTQIADTLGFGSVHYFSRAFKKATGMSPSDYASSIKLKSEGAFTPPQL